MIPKLTILPLSITANNFTCSAACLHSTHQLTTQRVHPTAGKLLLIMPTQARQVWTGWMVTFRDIHTFWLMIIALLYIQASEHRQWIC